MDYITLQPSESYPYTPHRTFEVSEDIKDEYERLDTEYSNSGKNIFSSYTMVPNETINILDFNSNFKLKSRKKLVPCYRFNGCECSPQTALILLEK